MTWSLNEVTALARKAARGAGNSWGIAEEAGRAVNWLAARGVDGPGIMARLLVGQGGVAMAPRIDAYWADDGWLCPIMTGAALSDRAMALDDTVRFHRLAMPLLLAPAVATVARLRDVVLQVDWRDGSFVTDGRDLWVNANADNAETATMMAVSRPTAPARLCTARVRVDLETAAILNDFAVRTYAPATDASRAGAGAQGSDND